MQIVLATHNQDKLREMAAALDTHGLEILTLDSFPEIGDIIEDGTSLKENALIKARTVHQITRLPSFADDTGLEVDALNGEPGIFTARYAGENCSYEDNLRKLLQEMEKIPQNARTARFRTVIAYVDNREELASEGVVEGLITIEPKGVGGFGYDSVFYIPDKGKTFSEMTMIEKGQISHRGRAIRNMKDLLRSRLPHIFQQMEDPA